MTRRGIGIVLSLLGGATVVLMVALAVVGTELDETRLDRQTLKSAVGDLQQEIDRLIQQRQMLKQQADERLRTTEQLKVELTRSHHSSEQVKTQLEHTQRVIDQMQVELGRLRTLQQNAEPTVAVSQ